MISKDWTTRWADWIEKGSESGFPGSVDNKAVKKIMLKSRTEIVGNESEECFLVSKRLFMLFGKLYGPTVCVVPNSYLFQDTKPMCEPLCTNANDDVISIASSMQSQ